MIRFIPIKRLNPYLFYLSIILFIFFPFCIFYQQQYSHTFKNKYTTKSTDNIRYEKYCQKFKQRIKNEKKFSNSILIDPKNNSIPYSYSQWRSTLLMPRLLTQCEHAIYMDLLSILIKNVFKKYNIQYMMMAATLLGSYTRHDLLPWDDDVDIRVSISDRYYFQSIILRELSSEPYSIVLIQIHNERNYDKVYFSWCPHNTPYRWHFPYIDIFYHDQNSTHVWLIGTPSSCPVRREDIFPLVYRPLGSLWLYSPREPMAHFESRKMQQIETGCFVFPYSHKYEKQIMPDILYAKCSQLKPFYPYVERKCENNQCIELLKLGEKTIIHKLIYNYTYRTFLYAETNQSYRAC